jgi:hypothetical protein
MARDDVYEDYDEVAPPKDGLGNGLVILTFLVLLLAVYFMQKALGDHFGVGLFGNKSAPQAPPTPTGT